MNSVKGIGSEIGTPVSALLDNQPTDGSLVAVSQSGLTVAQQRLVDLDIRKKEIEEYYKLLEATLSEVAQEVGLNGYFQADDGTIYKIVKPEGRFVMFKDLEYLRTKREGESRGTLSRKEGEEGMAGSLQSTQPGA